MNADSVEINAGLVDHLQFCRYILPCILAKLFNLIIRSSYVPAGFGRSYTVPILNVSNVYGKSFPVEDFRGVSISSLISKVVEHCILGRYGCFLKRMITSLVLKRA